MSRFLCGHEDAGDSGERQEPGRNGVVGLAIFVMMIVNYRFNWWLAFILAIAGTAGMSIRPWS